MKNGRQEGRKFKRRDEGTQEIGYEKVLRGFQCFLLIINLIFSLYYYSYFRSTKKRDI